MAPENRSPGIEQRLWVRGGAVRTKNVGAEVGQGARASSDPYIKVENF